MVKNDIAKGKMTFLKLNVSEKTNNKNTKIPKVKINCYFIDFFVLTNEKL